MRVDCVQWLQDLERLTPSVVVHPKSPTDGDLVDPGAHVFRYEAEGFAPVDKVLVSSGERSRVLDVTFERVRDKPSASSAEPARSLAIATYPFVTTPRSKVGVGALPAGGSVRWSASF